MHACVLNQQPHVWVIILTCLLLSVPVLAWEDVARLASPTPSALFTASAGTCTSRTDADGLVYQWRPQAGETARLALRPDAPVFAHLRDYDRLSCEFRIVAGEISSLDVRATGHVSGARRYKMHQWTLAVRTTPRTLWHTRDLDLARPNWFEWDNPDGGADDTLLAFDTLALTPGTIIELRNLRLIRNALVLKPDYELPITWPVKAEQPDGSATYTLTFQVLNVSGTPDRCTVSIRSAHSRFTVSCVTPSVAVKAAAVATFTVTATMTKADREATDELYAEPLQLAFALDKHPDAACLWQGTLVRPLSADIRRQVVLAVADLATAKAALTAGDARMKQLLDDERLRAKADEFCAKRLAHIPQGNRHVTNAYPGDWRPGDMMPEAVNTVTGERQVGTELAGTVWKEYLGYSGRACENLGMAYLLTGDERYAQKAIELLTLYGAQYTELPWRNMFDPPWNSGPNILASSRVAGNCTYGTNWYSKDHCRLLSMVADSPSWTPTARQQVYTGFVLPLATEMLKVVPPISNQSDITNHDLLLLGLACDDALLVHEALLRDAGLLKRLDDLDADGFSSEGRPLNYHFGEMAEYLPSLEYLANAGLRLDFPRDRILAAFRMPYARAALDGRVPNSGDCGRWQQVGMNPLADSLVTLFPDEQWLTDIGGATTFAKKIRLYRQGAPADPRAWQHLLETAPRVFPAAGLAILRTGTTPATQIMVTLDYGRSIFHYALDRNQVTLMAFGKVFTHGTGSLYNAGTQGMIRRRDVKLERLIGSGSLGQNVVLVDAQNQQVCVGELLAWSADPAYQVAVSRVPGIADGVTHTRGVVLTKGLVILLDRLESRQSHTYDFVYHNFGVLTPGKGWTTQPVTEPLATTANYDSMKDVNALHGTGPLHLYWDLTGQMPSAALKKRQADGTLAPIIGLQLWHLARPGDALYTGVTGMNNPNTQTVPDAAPSVIHRQKGSTVDFVTVLEPVTGPVRVQTISPVDGGVTITLCDATQMTMTLEALIQTFPARHPVAQGREL